jgi:hypothetical protein
MSRYKVPPSLNWLLDNRRRIAGHILKIEGKLAKFGEKYDRAKIIVNQHDVHLPALLRTLESDLAALDRAISLHQIDVDTKAIPPVREHERRFRYGNMTPTIYDCFVLGPREWLSTNEIASFVTTKRFPKIREYEFPEYRTEVRRHLKAMLKRGLVEEMPAKGLAKDSLWRCTNPRIVLKGLATQGVVFPAREDAGNA